MSKKFATKVCCSIVILVLISGIGFLSLPSYRHTGENLLAVIAAVLSGPILGTVLILQKATLAESYQVLIAGLVICLPSLLWYLKRRTILSFLIASLLWDLTGFLLCIAIYI